MIAWLPDVHGVNKDKRAWEACLSDLKKSKPDEIVLLGDFMDLSGISSHVKDSPGLWDPIEEEFVQARKDLEAICGLTNNVTYVLGNHELRLDKTINRLTWLKGSFDIGKRLGLKELGVRLHPHDGTPLKRGGIWGIHGLYVGSGHAKKTAQAYGHDVIYGHTHDIESYTTQNFGPKATATSIGCLCRKNMDYMARRPSKWRHAYATTESSGRKYSLTLHMID